ncbi:MAG TPA: LLM class flavin-dependent oxidoreductase [Thermomicrobiales bacterium]|nr:LLM class flavin-dependent oxidoreductase [Thermomicrobiales bacterium]
MSASPEWGAASPIWFESRRPMSLGLMVPIRERTLGGDTPRFADLVAVATTAREAGFEALWFGDHFTMGDGDAMTGAWEAWTMMAAVAARVPDIQIGPLVSCTGFRNPGLIAKMTESLDEISGGRFVLGLGAGWNATEYRQFGYPFDFRASRFEESIQIVRSMLRHGTADLQGRFWQANDAVNQPRGPRPEGAPLLVGTNGERLLGSVARYADAWNSDWENDPATMATLIARVDAACEAIGRSPSTLVKTGSARFAMDERVAGQTDLIAGTVDEMAGRLVAFQDLGVRHLVCGLEPRTVPGIADFGEVIACFDARA